jgi:hypothetical protein
MNPFHAPRDPNQLAKSIIDIATGEVDSIGDRQRVQPAQSHPLLAGARFADRRTLLFWGHFSNWPTTDLWPSASDLYPLKFYSRSTQF